MTLFAHHATKGRFPPGIACGTMTRAKLKKLSATLDQLRRGPQRAAALQSLAKRLGRAKVKRGKEPTWESAIFGHLRPLSIPDHGGGRDLAPGTQASILNQLEDDLYAWEQKLDEEEG